MASRKEISKSVKEYNKNAKTAIKSGEFGKGSSKSFGRMGLVDKVTKSGLKENSRKSVTPRQSSVAGAANKVKAQGSKMNTTPSTTAAARAKARRKG